MNYAVICVPALGHKSIFSLWIQIKYVDRILKRRKQSLYTSVKPTSLIFEITIYTHSTKFWQVRHPQPNVG